MLSSLVLQSSYINTVIWLGSRQQLAKLSEADKSLQLPDGLVRSSTTVKNLGVVIDERLLMIRGPIYKES